MNVKTFKTLVLVAGVAACFSASASTTISFSPTGVAAAAIPITTLDQAPGNALAVAQTTNAVGNSFTLLYQANLQAAQNGSTQAFSQGQGGNFFTFVAGFGETLVAATPVVVPNVINNTILSFAFDASNPNNFFRMYAQSAAGNDLAGTGFSSTAMPILTGHFIADGYSSSFTIANDKVTGAPIVAPLDSFGGNSYPGINTVTGSGATALTLVIDTFDLNYFPSLVKGATSSLINTSQVLAFSQIDPSALFTNMNGTTRPGATSVGSLNGVTGPNTMFQADANQSFNVPEPLPIALIGMGLVGMGLARRRSKKS